MDVRNANRWTHDLTGNQTEGKETSGKLCKTRWETKRTQRKNKGLKTRRQDERRWKRQTHIAGRRGMRTGRDTDQKQGAAKRKSDLDGTETSGALRTTIHEVRTERACNEEETSE